MTKNGWIKLYRKLRDNPLWKQKPYSKGQAWVDLLLRANHKDHEILIGNKKVEIKRGEVFTSELKLAQDWGWSRHKVANFLNALAGRNQMQTPRKCDASSQIGTPKRTSKYTLLSIVNWQLYQSESIRKDTKKDIKRTSKGHQKDTNKNVKNDKNEKESKPKPCEAENLASPPSLPEHPARGGEKTKAVPEQTATQPEMSQIREVFTYWQQTFNHPKALLSKDRVGKIRSRLREDYTIPQLKRSIDGCKASKYHMGDNKYGKVYDSIGLIFRSAEKVEDFWGYLEKKKPESPTAKKLRELKEKELKKL